MSKNKKYKGTPFYIQITSLLVTITVALTINFYYRSLDSKKRNLDGNFKEQATLLSKTVQLGLEIGLQTENFGAIKTVFSWAKSQKNLSWIIILDEKKEIFAKYPTKMLKKKYLSEKRKSLDGEYYIIENSWKVGDFGGSLIIGFETKELKKIEKEIFRYSLSVAAITVIITSLLSLGLSKFIINPLDKLQLIIGQIAGGDFFQKIDQIKGSREIVGLTHAFNQMMGKLNTERSRSESLLLNILPAPIAERLKNGETNIAISMDNVSILFADIVGFTKYSSSVSAEKLVDMLNIIFSRFDDLTKKYKLEKIKTIGDNYMLAGGMFDEVNHEIVIFNYAKEMLIILEEINNEFGTEFQVRIGIHRGGAVAGVLGKMKFIFDVWGDSVNVASRMESNGFPGKIHVSEAFKNKIEGIILLKNVERREIEVKGKGMMTCFFIG